MKKEEFIKKLREKLSILEEKEIEDIVAEYTGYIDEKMQKGATEEEAIKDFGSIEELTKELLEAYKINVNQNHEKNWILKITDKMISWTDQFIKVFTNKTASEILKIVFEIIMIIFFIALCKIPFGFLEDLGFKVFLIAKSNVGIALYQIWQSIIELVYLFFAIIFFMKIFEKRYLNNEEIRKEEIHHQEKKPIKKSRTLPNEEIYEKRIIEKEPKKGILDVLSTACLYFVKFLVFWIEFGIACFILAMGICLGISFFFLIKGVNYYGIYISILAILFLAVLAFIAIFNFLFNRKNNVRFLLISFITCFLILGLSFSAASIEIATTEFINEVPSEYRKEIITQTLAMDENFIIMETVEFIEEETLSSELKIDFSYYPEFYTINPKIEQEKNRIYFIRNYTQSHWNTKMLDMIINDLKDHRLYNYSMMPKIKIYTSKENITTLKENRRKWEQKYYFDISNCEEQYQEEGYQSLSPYCKKIIEGNW